MSSLASSYIIELSAYMVDRSDAETAGEIKEEASALQLPNLVSIRSTKRRRRQGQFFKPSPSSSRAASPSLSWSSSSSSESSSSPSSSSESDPEPSSPCASLFSFSPPSTPTVPTSSFVSISKAKTARATPPPLLLRFNPMQVHGALPSSTLPPSPLHYPPAPPPTPAPMTSTRTRPAASHRRSSRAHPPALAPSLSSASYARRRNIAKLTRTLGEPVPAELVRAVPRRPASLRAQSRAQEKRKKLRVIDELGYLATGLVLDAPATSATSTATSTTVQRAPARPPRRAPIPEVWMQIHVCTTTSADARPAFTTCTAVPPTPPSPVPVATTHATGLGHGHAHSRSQQLTRAPACRRDSRLPHARTHSEPRSALAAHIQLHPAPFGGTDDPHPAPPPCVVSTAPAPTPFLFDVAGFDEAIAARLRPLDAPPFATLRSPFVLEGEHGELLGRCESPTTAYGAWNCTDMGAVRRGLRGLRGGR